MSIKTALQGKKTYLTAAASVIGAISAYAEGSATAIQAAQIIVPAVLAVTVHSKISRTLSSILALTGALK